MKPGTLQATYDGKKPRGPVPTRCYWCCIRVEPLTGMPKDAVTGRLQQRWTWELRTKDRPVPAPVSGFKTRIPRGALAAEQPTLL